MNMGNVLKRVSAGMRANVEKIEEALEGSSDLEIVDALILALVEHIEEAAPEHRLEVARGVAWAITANFSVIQPQRRGGDADCR